MIEEQPFNFYVIDCHCFPKCFLLFALFILNLWLLIQIYFFQDQYDNIASATNKGLELLDKYGQFTKELSAIETDYAGKLRRLVKNYMIKKKDEEENM